MVNLNPISLAGEVGFFIYLALEVPLIRSGLFGPVRIIALKPVE
jgi:hypothetical protein